VLDEAVAALPERFRSAVVLCDLYELSRAEAAARLGIPEGTLSSRLNTARKRLAARLARRGLAAVALGGAARAAVSPDLARRTIATAVAGAGGGPVAAGVRSLATGGGLTMRKLIGWVVASAAVAGLAVGAVAALPGPDRQPPNSPVAKEAEPKADWTAPAAPKPSADGEKPVRAGKPRLVRTFELTARVTDIPIWSPDGDLLAVEESGGAVAVYDTRAPAVREIVRTNRQSSPLGFLAGKPMLVTYWAAPGRINAENRLLFWDVSTLPPPAAAPGPARAPVITAARTVEYDLSDGTPFAVLPDGKAVLTLTVTQRRSKSGVVIGGSAVVRLLDATTGEPVRELARVEGDLHTASLAPDGKSLAVVYDRLGEPADTTRPQAVPSRTAVVESIDVPDGKRRWSREFKGWKKSGGIYALPLKAVYSPDRKWLAVTLQETAKERTATVGSIRLLDAGTGKDGPPVEDQASEFNKPMSFSHDGQLLVGYARTERGEPQLRVWDVRTGRLRKSWDGTALAAFAPDRPVLAILENVSDGRNDPPQAVLGFWDLAALLK
jgi:WD40 repeat protein